MEKELWGTTKDGKEILLYTLSNRNGEKRDVVLGFDRGEDYLSNDAFMGAVVAPSANRIAGASFTIGNKKFRLEQNENENNLHGSFTNGSHLNIWASEGDGRSVTFSLKMHDGELGFPGEREMSVTYTLTDDNGLDLSYRGVSDQKTLFNPTNHVYFNLSGHASGKILATELVAKAYEPQSGIEMTVLTTFPGMQFYTGNWIGEKAGKGGAVYKDRHGFCLETQFFPNAINQDGFESPVFGEKEDYRSETIYRFGIR